MAQQKIIALMQELKHQLDLEIQALPRPAEFEVIHADDLTALGKALRTKRKALQLDLQTLSLQTGLSLSTLKRLFNDPSQIKFMSVVLVAETLGIRLCFAK